MPQDSDGLNIERSVGVISRRAPLIVLCFVLATGAAFASSKNQTKKYTATASLVFSNNQLSQQLAGLQAVSNNNQTAQQSTDLKLIQLGDMAGKAARKIGHGLTEGEIKEDLSVTAQGESNIVDVSATAISPTLAAEIANTYTSEFVAQQQSSNSRSFASALGIVRRQLSALSLKQRASTQGLALQQRAQSLEIFSLLESADVQVAQAATVPTSSSSPKVARNTVLGAILGLLLGLSLAFLLERFDQRIREPKDLESIYGLPLLGVVPESAALSRSGRRNGDAQAVLPSGEVEAFHLIRAHLRYFNVDHELHTLMIASAAPGDGKTTIARHLTGAAARMGSRVLLLEADLRRPTIAQQLDIASGPGVADVLIGAVSLSEATQTVDLKLPRVDGSPGRGFDVLVAGASLPPNPGELIESHAMESLLQQAKAKYDLIVVDTPPLTAVSDAFPLLGKVDGVIIVGRVGRNRRDVAQRLHETLTGAGAPLLGVVANGLKSGRLGGYGYGYSYDYVAGRDKAASDDSAAASANGATASEEPLPAAKG